jgi:PhoH-like ATPase
MLTLLTRAAEGCKIVIAGCVDQIDNPRLDKYNNGLSFAIERFKDSGFAAQVTFTDDECVRSPLAAEASRLLVDN